MRQRRSQATLALCHPRNRDRRDRIRRRLQLRRLLVGFLFVGFLLYLFGRISTMDQRGAASWKLLAAAIALLLVLWFAWDLFSGEEGRIRKTLRATIEAVENEDVYGLLGQFSQDYQDDMGIAFPMIFKLAQTGFARYDDIDVDISNVRIEINQDSAKVMLTIWGEATHAASKGQDALPMREAFEQTGAILHLRKTGGDWQISSSERVSLSAAIR